MATTTPNFNLTKPAATDFYDINVHNDNMDKIDAGALPKSIATAADQVPVSTDVGAWAVKTLAQIKAWLGLGSAAYTASTAYATSIQGTKADNAIPKGTATAADQVLISSGSGAWIVKVLADFKTWLGLGSAAYKTVGSALGNIPENAAALGSIDNAAVVTDAVGKLKPHAKGALKDAAFCDAEGAVTNDSSKVPTGAAIVALLGRSTPVTGDDTNYGTYMARGAALSATETTPTYNGQICWQYE